MPKPAMVAFTWGFALSTAAAIRKKVILLSLLTVDDVKNHLYASAAVGAVISAMSKGHLVHKKQLCVGNQYGIVDTGSWDFLAICTCVGGWHDGNGRPAN
ncbi:unnamed protein product [Cylicostephanus goldi]|uniref:Uncharacterized protein n=1 Tax=Cylicostephanus goldi TaxID=71465 RepID=A0A3P6SQI5_CYLGO|nr:unnamed protein product [Cylicostephanus goldi]